MRAMALTQQRPAEDRPLHLIQLPTPIPGQDEVLIRVAACGVCHTDLHIVEGDLPLMKSPLVPGHQIVGRVEELGPGVDGLARGDRVGVAWLHSTCGECRYCRRGEENLCPRAKFTGWHVDGGFAEYVVAPADFVYRLPEGTAAVQLAPLLCGGIIGYRALRLSGVRQGARLGLYGFGASAHIASQVAIHWGCRVYVFTRSPEHKRLAQDLGAEWVGEARDRPPEPLDAAIVFAPAGWMVPEALKSLDRGGRVVLAGIHMSPIPELPYRLLYWERSIKSVANATRADGVELLALAAEIPIRTQVEAFPLERANEVLLKLKQRRVNGAAVLTVSV